MNFYLRNDNCDEQTMFNRVLAQAQKNNPNQNVRFLHDIKQLQIGKNAYDYVSHKVKNGSLYVQFE